MREIPAISLLDIAPARTLAAMTSRWFLCLIPMFLTPVWAQEPAANQPAATPRSFDLSSEAIKKIVRETAADQSVPIQISEGTTISRERDTAIRFVPPEKEQPAKEQSPRRPAAPPEPVGPVSALIEALVDTALGVDHDSTIYYSSCPPTDALNTPAPNYENCQLVPR